MLAEWQKDGSQQRLKALTPCESVLVASYASDITVMRIVYTLIAQASLRLAVIQACILLSRDSCCPDLVLLLTVDALATGTVSGGEVTTYVHRGGAADVRTALKSLECLAYICRNTQGA